MTSIEPTVELSVAEHPLLDGRALLTVFPRPLETIATSSMVASGLAADADTPMKPDDQVRQKIRTMLRVAGFKPTGRSKPASEFLLGVAQKGPLHSINAAVDACNVASLHSGLPISVVDFDRLGGPLTIATAEAGASYVFNPSGQVIDVGNLVCLHDDTGPCANAVKDAQRTKTGPATVRTLSIVWGSRELGGLSEQTRDWYAELLASLGAQVSVVL